MHLSHSIVKYKKLHYNKILDKDLLLNNFILDNNQKKNGKESNQDDIKNILNEIKDSFSKFLVQNSP